MEAEVKQDKDQQILLLQREVEMLRAHIEADIKKNCGYFCALPVCPKDPPPL